MKKLEPLIAWMLGLLSLCLAGWAEAENVRFTVSPKMAVARLSGVPATITLRIEDASEYTRYRIEWYSGAKEGDITEDEPFLLVVHQLLGQGEHEYSLTLYRVDSVKFRRTVTASVH